VDVPVGVFVCRLWSFCGVFFLLILLLVACRVLEVIIFIVV